MDKTIESQRAMVATRIMDFEEWEPWKGSGMYWRLKDQPWQGWHGRQAWWKPDQDIWQAMQLAKALRQMGYEYQVTALPENDNSVYRGQYLFAIFRDCILMEFLWADKLEQAIFAVAAAIAEQMEEEKS